MRITDVQLYLYTVPAFQPAFRWRLGLPGSEPECLCGWLRISTGEGVDGFAPVQRAKIFADLLERRIKAELIGQDPLRREWLWQRMWELDRIEEFPIYVFGIVDVALWDLAAKAAGLPLYRYIGGFREKIPAQASTVTYGSVEEYLDIAGQCLELGYPAIKLHAWGDARQDARLCLELRKHLGDAVPLMYDGSAGFDLADAIYLGKALEEAGYYWYEEPMREFNVASYRRLSEAVRVPLLVAETSDGCHFNTADFIAQVNCSFVRTGSDYRGGITGALRTAHLAEAYGLRAEVHGGGLANTHLSMSIPNTTWYESLVFGNPVQRREAIDAQGFLHAPERPGVGWEVDLKELERKAAAVL